MTFCGGSVVLIWAAGASGLFAGTGEAGNPPAPSLSVFTCSNGLEVVVERRPGTRTVFMEIGVRVGSRDEPLALAGMSHLLEHLLFKEGHDPAARRNPAFSALRAVGAEINASTDFELTEYHADVPAGRFLQGWDALVALVTATDFSDDELRRERGVVLGEVALGKTDPLAIMAYSVLRRVFPGDPLGQPVIGFRKTLNRITKADVQQYYRRFYRPANMFVVVVGDVDLGDAVSRVRQTLGVLPAGGPARTAYPAPTQNLGHLYRFRTLVSQSYLIAGSLTGGNEARDAPALELLASILGGGRTSRLHRRFVERDALTDEVLAISFSVSNVGAFGCGLTVERRRTEEARAGLREELVRLTEEPVTAEELDTVKKLLRGALALELETNSGTGGFRARRLFLHQPVSQDTYLAVFDALTADDLMRVARKHWGSGARIETKNAPGDRAQHGAAENSGASPPAKSGSSPADSRSQQGDSGPPPVDSGSKPVESGSNPAESASTPVDSASKPVESGSSSVGSGSKPEEGPGGPVAIEVLPARGFGKVIAALKFLVFRRL